MKKIIILLLILILFSGCTSEGRRLIIEMCAKYSEVVEEDLGEKAYMEGDICIIQDSFNYTDIYFIKAHDWINGDLKTIWRTNNSKNINCETLAVHPSVKCEKLK